MLIQWTRRCTVGLALGAAAAMPVAASTLSDMAANMQPGSWSILNRAGDASGFNFNLIVSCAGSDCGDNILNFADKGMWNPVSGEMHFIGQGHLRELKHISYSAVNNRWVKEAQPPWSCGAGCWSDLGHGFEHTAINPANGDVYARKFNETNLYKWTRASKTWTQVSGSAPNPAVALSIEYFPEMGGLVLSGGGEVHIFRESGGWTRLASGLTMGGYSNVSTYNPVHKVIVLGGGNGGVSQMYKLNASGTVSAIANAPVAVGIQQTVFTVDPASGKFLLLGQGGGFYQYDVPSNQWSSLPSSGVPIFSSNSNRILFRSAIPITTYGVVAYLVEDGTSNTRVVLYRHAAGQGGGPIDTTPPAAPTGLSIQ